MMSLARFLVVVLFLIAGAAAFAGDVRIGGYDMEFIIRSTNNLLEVKGIIEKGAKSGGIDSSDLFDPQIIDFYDELGASLVKKGVFMASDVETARKRAAESGGVKIGGLNPVVLAASYLDLLAAKGIISYGEAQAVLDSAMQVK